MTAKEDRPSRLEAALSGECVECHDRYFSREIHPDEDKYDLCQNCAARRRFLDRVVLAVLPGMAEDYRGDFTLMAERAYAVARAVMKERDKRDKRDKNPASV